MSANEKAAPGWHPEAALRTAFDDPNSTSRTRPLEAAGGTHGRYPALLNRLVEAVNLRESEALDCLKNAIVAIGLPPSKAVAIFAAASSYAKAQAARILAERGVRQ